MAAGEHLIFARTRGGNRYLFLAPHGTPEDRLAASARVCLSDFPELSQIAASLPTV